MIRTEEIKQRHAAIEPVEKERDALSKHLRAERASSKYIERTGNDPTNWERQLGKALPAAEVERRLKKLNPALTFETTLNNTKKYVIMNYPDGTSAKLLLYESGVRGLIPEHSKMAAVIKEDLDPAVVESRFHLDRKDLTKHEVIPHEFNEDGSIKRLGDVVFDDTVPMVGMSRYKREWSEQVRGWRTMLVMLMAMGVINPTATEQMFGSCDRPEWAAAMGRRVRETPW